MLEEVVLLFDGGHAVETPDVAFQFGTRGELAFVFVQLVGRLEVEGEHVGGVPFEEHEHLFEFALQKQFENRETVFERAEQVGVDLFGSIGRFRGILGNWGSGCTFVI